MADEVIASLANRYVRSYDKGVITQLFSYQTYIKLSLNNCLWLCLGQLSTLGLDIQLI